MAYVGVRVEPPVRLGRGVEACTKLAWAQFEWVAFDPKLVATTLLQVLLIARVRSLALRGGVRLWTDGF